MVAWFLEAVAVGSLLPTSYPVGTLAGSIAGTADLDFDFFMEKIGENTVWLSDAPLDLAEVESTGATVTVEGANGVIPGDVDGSGLVDLDDAVCAFQVCVGMTPSSEIQVEADINGDEKIGLQEAMYALRVVSGL